MEAILSRVRVHLKPDGRFAIDVFVPKMELLVDKPGERSSFAEYEDPDGKGQILMTHSYVYEPDTQIKRVKTYTVIPGQIDEIEGELNMHMFFPRYLEVLLKYNGFELEARYGDYDRVVFNPYHSQIAPGEILVCPGTDPAWTPLFMAFAYSFHKWYI